MFLQHPFVAGRIGSRGLLLALGAFGVLGCSGPSAPGGPPTFVSQALTTARGDSGLLTAETRTSPQPPQRGLIAVELTVSNVVDGSPVDGLVVHTVPFMPAYGHGSSLRVDVSAQGGGKYLLTNVDLFMAGTWQLRTNLSGPVTDYLAPEFDVP